MWEIPIYLIFAPVLTIIISLLCRIRFKKYFMAPLIIFFILNIQTVVVPIFYNVGWEGIFGWAIFYTVISLIISLIMWSFRKKYSFPKSA
ncbi:DUF2651 family protein [Anaerobacillus isosaccharinicus]|uniref:DUF2651 family protein n=1 Tax=Anaerobacillus isosaccharinicus TaxID=1532552 RepID=A0A1S2LSX5_9BACI|nr:DUF2651 family protein [Anaerobacillus isosaccharinicus]QOY36917.1 DUF2651 family protein [Anaerobacillus isosaccharinicus]